VLPRQACGGEFANFIVSPRIIDAGSKILVYISTI